ncbi:MAG: hypothetical protein LBT15_06855, partial [Synergistaceae bacterium]|nr:hypothetical protein [Synergistaceae bacterium]
MICLVNMPFVALRKQSLGLPLVSGILKDAGLEVATLYFNFDLAGMMGVMEYLRFTDSEEIPTCFLQWLFAGIAWGWDSSREDAALDGLLEYYGKADAVSLAERLRNLRRGVLPRFMD